MKKPGTTLALFLILIPGIKAQETVHFKTSYKPGKKYNIETKQVASISMVSEVTEMAEMMKAQGFSQPIITTTISTIQTGKKDKSTGIFPLTIKIVKSESNNEQAAIPEETIIYGHATENDMPVLDSIAGVEDETKELRLTTLKSMFDQFKLPDTSLKVGDSISMDNDFQSPMPGMDFDMVMTTVYKLVNVSNNVAEFDVFQRIKTRDEENASFIKMTGSGKGKLLYDIISNVNLNYKIDFETHMKMLEGDAEIVLHLSSDQSVEMVSK